ncbi:MAG: TonB-dependent receptor [Steroidobacteraceae bacterium]
MTRLALRAAIGAALATTLALPARAADATAPTDDALLESLVVTASKLPTALESLPAMVTVVDGQEARDRGARDLRTALALVAGVDIAPGGDGGPASSVPGMMGLREADAYLLVVDGIPVGGTFNPQVATLSLENVERIEVLRGAAPVMYGATSFVGVLYVVNYAAGATPTRVTVAGGGPNTGIASVTANLPTMGGVKQSVAFKAQTQDYTQDDSNSSGFHGMYRAAVDTGLGELQADLEGTTLDQQPYSPHPREGGGLSDRFPTDANVNPKDARQDQDRIQANLRLVSPVGSGKWVTTASYAHLDGRTTRGFLREDFAVDGVTPNADGFRQTLDINDFYFDSYFEPAAGEHFDWLVGADWMYGDGTQQSKNFEYAVLPDGSNRPDSGSLPIDEETRTTDRRSFGGLYTQANWRPTDRWLVQGGLRWNLTDEERASRLVDHTQPGDPVTKDKDSASESKLSGVIGVSYRVWGDAGDGVTVFGDYRDTYKPAAVDFGPEAEGGILEPETATTWEAGLKGRHLAGRLEWELAWFDMDFENLVIPENVDGLPSLANAGSENFTGLEMEAFWRVTDDLRLAATYAYHDSTFTDYARLRPDGSVQQLKGNTLEMSPNNLASGGIVYAPADGPQASVTANYVGSRWLNKGNTVKADAYTVVDAGIGWRHGPWLVRLDGYNLTDARDPVAESELGDAQFYTMPGVSWLLSVTWTP